MRAQHVVQRARRVERDRKEDRGALALQRPQAEPAALARPALERLAIGVQVEDVGRARDEEQAVAAVAFGLGGQLALAQLHHRDRGVADLPAAVDAVEDAAAVVRHQHLQVEAGLAHRDGDAAAAAVVDRIVQQLGEGMLGQAGDMRLQVQQRREVARPGQVLLQPGQRVVADHLAHRAGPVAHLPWRAAGGQPLGVDQRAEQLARAAAAVGQALHDMRDQVVAMPGGGGGDPGGGGGKGGARHGGSPGDATVWAAAGPDLSAKSTRIARQFGLPARGRR
jgi:hypothetical protein